MKALKTFEELKQTRRVGACYHSIGDLYFEQKDFNRAHEYFRKTLQMSIETGDKVRESNMNLAIGNVYIEMNKYDTARIYFNRAVSLFDTLGYQHSLDDCFKSIGISYLMEQKPDSALIFLNLAKVLSEKENDKINLAGVYGNTGYAYLLKNEFEKALKFIQMSLDLANECGAPKHSLYAYENLIRVYSELGNKDKELEYFKRFASMKDSLFRADQYRAVTEMEVKYETEKKEQNIALLIEQNKVHELSSAVATA